MVGVAVQRRGGAIFARRAREARCRLHRPFFRPQTTPNGEWQRAYFTFSAARRCNRRNRRSISPFAPAGQKILALLRSPYHDFLPLFAPPLGTHGRPARGSCAGKPSCALAASREVGGSGGRRGRRRWPCRLLAPARCSGRRRCSREAMRQELAPARTARDDAPRGGAAGACATLLACAGPCWSCRPRAAAPSKLHVMERAL